MKGAVKFPLTSVSRDDSIRRAGSASGRPAQGGSALSGARAGLHVIRSGDDRETHDRHDHEQPYETGCERQPEPVAAHFLPLHFEAAAALFGEKLFPILHVDRGLDEFPMEARLTCDGALDAGGAGAGALGEILCKLGMPCARGVGHGPLRGHPFLDCPAPIVTLVRLHWVPLR